MNPYLGIFLGVLAALISGIVFGCVAGNHTYSNIRRINLGLLTLLPGAAALAFLVPDMGNMKVALFLPTAGAGAAIIPIYMAYLYIRTSEGEDEAMSHRVVALYLGWPYRNRPYHGVQNQTGHPRSDSRFV